MIIGLATLISILFFGGISETFLVDKLEKGAKQYIVDKERKKEITAELKEASKYIKAFNKKRKAQMKAFQDLNLNRDASRKDFSDFFDELIKERKQFQEKVLSNRVSLAKKIEQEEWDNIMKKSGESLEKKEKKLQKKTDKGKISQPFEKTNATIDKFVTDAGRKDKIHESLDQFIASQKLAVETLADMNSKDSDIISKKDATKEELMEMALALNELRFQALNNLVDFHMSAKEYLTQAEWDKIMKAFNKEMSITAH